MSDSDSDSSGNLTEEEERLDHNLHRKSAVSSDSDIPQPKKQREKPEPKRIVSRQPMDEYDMVIRDTADECVTLYNERRTLIDERKLMTKKINDINKVIARLENDILRYLTTEDECGKVPPNVPVPKAGTFFVNYKEKLVKMDKDEKMTLFADVLREKQKEIGKNSAQVAKEVMLRIAPKRKQATLMYK